MRIAFVSEHASPLATLGGADAGGQNVHVACLATALAAQGHEVVVHTRRDGAQLPTCTPLAPGVTVHHVDAGPPHPIPKDELLPFMPAFGDELARFWDRCRPDVVHAHFWMSGMAALQAAGPRGIPTVQTFHALGTVKRRYQRAADTSPPDRIGIEVGIAREANAIVATCRDEVRELTAMGADPARISIVPCGVDVDAFRPPRRADGDGPLRVLSLGRMVERKGIADLIVAFAGLDGAELTIAGGPARANLGGDGEYRRLAAIAERVGVRATFCGQVARAEVPALLHANDVVVCAPWYEPFGIVPLEAMAAGLPVIASSVGGMLDTVVHGVTGLHVPPRQPCALRAAIDALIADPARRRRMGIAGLARARTRYTWTQVARDTVQAYGRVMSRDLVA